MTPEEYQNAVTDILSDKVVSWELADFFLGKLIGCGISRYVFDNPADKTTVIKIDVSKYNANVEEFTVWDFVKHKPYLKKHFAPVVRMSRCGRVLIMKKCKPIEPGDKLPAKLPHIFNDIKRDNFGYLKGQLVCLDYGINCLRQTGILGIKKIDVKW